MLHIPVCFVCASVRYPLLQLCFVCAFPMQFLCHTCASYLLLFVASLSFLLSFLAFFSRDCLHACPPCFHPCFSLFSYALFPFRSSCPFFSLCFPSFFSFLLTFHLSSVFPCFPFRPSGLTSNIFLTV